MKKTLIVSAACIAVYAGLPNPSVADAPLASESGERVETIVADLERRIEELEAKIGGETIKSAFQPRNPKVRHLKVPAQATSLN
jgi:hypothetical protein